ncbi:MAG: DUF6635 family protein [Reyranellaceae bacterium]
MNLPALVPPSREELDALVREAARRYFADRHARVDGFVARHFGVRGAASIHRRALGWDIVRAPVNLALAVPNVGLKLAAAGARTMGARRAGAWLGSRKLLMDTAVGREIQWRLITDLLELPCRMDGRRSEKDALQDAILAMPQIQNALRLTLSELARHGDEPGFRQKLEDAMLTYAGTRAAAAEITTSLLAVSAGAAVLHQATPGMMSLGPALAAALAQHAAVASFPLGTAAGGMWFGVFPAAVSPVLLVGVTGGLLAVGAVAAAFAGVIADPLQRRLGIHQRRLHRLIDTLEQQFCDGRDAAFTARDPYVARLVEVFDLLAAAARLARG